jgi:uncharacterized protein (DUF2141 family)
VTRGPILLLLFAACGAAQHRKPTEGSIAGLVRDHASGEPVAMADIRAAGTSTHSGADGMYAIDHVKPGRYTVDATFAGQPIMIRNVDVRAGEATFVDITFTLGNPDPTIVDFGDPTQGEIKRYHPKQLSPTTALIEGTVTDVATRERVIGAVVTAERDAQTLQTVTDDQGRYHFDSVMPGVYAVSAYYSVGGRGQIEVRRADIHVDGAERVEIPIWVETTKL